MLALGLNPRRHRVIRLVALVWADVAIMLCLFFISSPGSVETVQASFANQYSSLNLRFSPNPAHPGSTVTVNGNLPSPDENGFAFEASGCAVYSDQSGPVQFPNCLRPDGTIMASLQISPSTSPGTYSISLLVVFYNQFTLYSPYSLFSQDCSASPPSETMIVVTPTGNSTAYNCTFMDSSTLTIEPNPISASTTTITSTTTLSRTLTSTSTSTTVSVQQVVTQLTVPEAILTVSATAAATGAASRIYAKRHPGFDIEVKSGIDWKER